LNGLGGSIRQPSVLLDLLVSSAGPRTGGVIISQNGKGADSSNAADFGSHLAGLTKQENKSGDPSDGAGSPAAPSPVFVQQSLSLKKPMAQATEDVGDVSDDAASVKGTHAASHGSHAVSHVAPVANESLPGNSPGGLGSTDPASFSAGPPLGLPVVAASMESSSDGAASRFAPSKESMSHLDQSHLDGTGSGEGSKSDVSFWAASNLNSASEGSLGAPKVLVIDRQTHFALARGLLATQQIISSTSASVLLSAPGTARTFAPSVGHTPEQDGQSSSEDAGSQEGGESQTSSLSDPNSGDSSDIASSLPIKAATVDQKTFAASPKELPPAQQLANFIAASTDSNGTEANETTALAGQVTDAAKGEQGPTSSVKIMQLQLEPENLGKVTVTMRLTGSGLDLQVEASQPETVQLIRNDKDLLGSKLQSAGYELSTLVVQLVDRQASHPRLGTQMMPDGHQQSSSQAHGDSNHHDRPSPHERNHSHPAPAGDAQSRTGIGSSGGELFI
jgi:hypothetical protein